MLSKIMVPIITRKVKQKGSCIVQLRDGKNLSYHHENMKSSPLLTKDSKNLSCHVSSRCSCILSSGKLAHCWHTKRRANNNIITLANH